jgi:hypothetical protein
MANHSDPDDCVACEDLLAVREWLTDAEERHLATHLAGCPACRRREAALTVLAAEFAPPSATQPDPALTDRIMAAAAHETAERRHRESSPLIPALAALIMLELIAVSSLASGGAELAAGLSTLLGPTLPTASELGADTVGIWSDVAALSQDGLGGVGLDIGWLLTALAAGCAAVLVACHREFLGRATGPVSQGGRRWR